MTPEAADQRIILSRRTHSAWAQAFSAGDMVAPIRDYLRMIADEVAQLNQIATAFPNKAHKITNLIERYEVLARHMRGKMD